MRSVACKNWKCLEGNCSDVRANITSQCHNKFLDHWPSSLAIEIGALRFQRQFYSQRTTCIAVLTEHVEMSFLLLCLKIFRHFVHWKRACIRKTKLRNSTVIFVMSSPLSNCLSPMKTYPEIFGDFSKISLGNSSFRNVWQSIAKLNVSNFMSVCFSVYWCLRIKQFFGQPKGFQETYFSKICQ